MVDLGLYEPIVRILDDAIPVFGALGYVRERIGSAAESAAPHNHYESRDGRWMAVACTNDRMFARLARAMGTPELVARFPGVRDRLAGRAELDGLVQAWVGARDAAEALAALDAAEVPCALVNSVRDLFADPQLRPARTSWRCPSRVWGTVHMPGVVPRLTGTPGRDPARRRARGRGGQRGDLSRPARTRAGRVRPLAGGRRSLEWSGEDPC